MNKPLCVVLAFDPEDAPIPRSKLSDELCRRFHELMAMPLHQRQVEIDKIWDQHKGVK
jgi:hypothetical protein